MSQNSNLSLVEWEYIAENMDMGLLRSPDWGGHNTKDGGLYLISHQLLLFHLSSFLLSKSPTG